MITAGKVRALALALPQAEEHPHFQRPSFRVRGRIFAVIHAEEGRVTLKLSVPDQSAALSSHPEIFEAAAGAWGRQGWTYLRMKTIPTALFQLLLRASWAQAAPRSLVSSILPPSRRQP